MLVNEENSKNCDVIYECEDATNMESKNSADNLTNKNKQNNQTVASNLSISEKQELVSIPIDDNNNNSNNNNNKTPGEMKQLAHRTEKDELNTDKKLPVKTNNNNNGKKLRICIPTKKKSDDILSNSYNTDNYYSSSLSSISSVSEISFKNSKLLSTELQLAKLKQLHTQIEKRKKLKRIKKIIYFIITKILILFNLIISILFLLIGYLLQIYWMLIVGCILCITSVGCFVQLCFTTRTNPNKFNPSSVPFALACEDLPKSTNCVNNTHLSVPISNLYNEQIKQINQTDLNTITNSISKLNNTTINNTHKSDTDNNFQTNVVPSVQFNNTNTPSNVPVILGMDQNQARRLSMALNRLASNSIQQTNYSTQEPPGVLKFARRLTMASTAMGMHYLDRDYIGHSWLTGTHIRHGVRRSLAWNESGASRFYEHNYD